MLASKKVWLAFYVHVLIQLLWCHIILHLWNLRLQTTVSSEYVALLWDSSQLLHCLGRDTVLRHALVGHSFRHSLVWMQFHDMHRSRHTFTTCTGWDPVLWHALVRVQFYDIHGSLLIKSITYDILLCLRMFPQSTAVYFIGNCTNLGYISCSKNIDLYNSTSNTHT